MKTQIRLFQKFQPNVQRGQLKNCQICGTKFGVFAPEHQCKRCLRAVCSNCGTNKRDVFKPKMVKSPHRICKTCSIQSTILTEYSNINKLKFGQDSELALKWLKKLPKQTKQQTNNKQQRKFTNQLFNQLWDSYNFSLRQFIGLHTFSMDQTSVYKQINKVFIELQQHGVDQKIQNIIYIIAFLLCFSSPQTCTSLTSYLLTLKRQVSDHKQFIQAYTKSLGKSQQQMKKIGDFINYQIKHYLGTYSINAVTSQCSIHVLSKAFQKQRIDQLYMILAIILEDNFQFLEKNKGEKGLCDYEIVRNCNMSKYLDKSKGLLQVKVAQFVNLSITSVNKAINKPVEEEEGRLRQSAALNPAAIIRSPGSTPPKPTLDKHQSFQSQPYEIKEFDPKINARQRALQNIARIKAKNAQLNQDEQQKQSQQSIDDDQKQKQKINKNLSNQKKQEERVQAQNQKVKQQTKAEKQQTMDDVFAQFNQTLLGVKNLKSPKKQENDEIKQNKRPSNHDLFQKPKQKGQRQRSVQKTKDRQNSYSRQKSQKKQPIIHFQKEHCQQCNVKSQRLQQLYQQIRIKKQQLQSSTKQLKLSQNQIQKLQLQIKQQKQKRQLNQQKQNSAEEIQKLKEDVMNGVQKYNNLMKEMLKIQKQNKILKNQVQQTALNNKVLKSKLEQASMGIGYTGKNNQKQQELSRQNQLLKKSIQSKNKQLHTLLKKNKQLTIQVDQLQKLQKVPNKEEEKAKQLQQQKQELLKKMKQLGDQIIKQQEQKLGLSSELFDLKRSQTQMPEIRRQSETKLQASQSQSTLNGVRGRASQCNIF